MDPDDREHGLVERHPADRLVQEIGQALAADSVDSWVIDARGRTRCFVVHSDGIWEVKVERVEIVSTTSLGPG